MKTLLGVLAIALGIIVIIFVARSIGSNHNNNGQKLTKATSVTIDNQKITLEEALTQKEQQIGLSGRDTMSENEGMIFPFNKADYYSFWMKNMKFPIDIIYLSKNKVISIFQNIPNPTFPTNTLTIYKPELPADMVVELKANEASKLNIKKGDILNISL